MTIATRSMSLVIAMTSTMGLAALGAACGSGGAGGHAGAGAFTTVGPGAGPTTSTGPGLGGMGVGGSCAATGDSCSENGDCCNFQSNNGFCVNFGQGGLCADSCTTDADCKDGCCAATESGNHVCSPPSACATPLQPPGGSCSSDTDCDQTKCDSASRCIDWHDGKGSVCSCECSWGTECASGCCWSVNNGTFFACRDASACAPIGGSCTVQYQCDNNSCASGKKTFCYDFSKTSGGECGCECVTNADCESGCCVNYGQFNACGDPSSFQCNG